MINRKYFKNSFLCHGLTKLAYVASEAESKPEGKAIEK